MTYTVAVKLTSKAKKALTKHHKVKVTPKVVYKPTNARKALTTKVKAITIKKKK